MENRNKEDISSEVNHSLEVLDDVLNYFDEERVKGYLTLRNLKRVPADARHSLEILDDILEQFDDEGGKLKKKSDSLDHLRCPKTMPSEVAKSLDDLDRVMDEFEKEGRFHSIKMRNTQNNSMRKTRNDDIRRSLEVLDNVLAEFDDCLDSWDSVPTFSNGNDVTNEALESHASEKNEKLLELTNSDSVSPIFSYDNIAIDGSTSQISSSEQAKIYSPPPIPKRSPTTKLTGEGHSGLFVFPADSSSLDSYDSARSCVTPQNGELFASTQNLLHQQSDETPPTIDSANQEACTVCGSALKDNLTESMETKDSLSPFMQRKKIFEDKIAEAGSNSPVLDRYRYTSLKVRKTAKYYEDNSGPQSLSSSLSPESGFGSDESPSLSFLERRSKPRVIKVSPPSIDLQSSTPKNHSANCNCRERIHQLDITFAETRRLLRENKIKGLNKKPPSFTPPPPPSVVVKNLRNNVKNCKEDEKENFSVTSKLEISRSQSFDSLRNTENLDKTGRNIEQNVFHPSLEHSPTLHQKQLSFHSDLSSNILKHSKSHFGSFTRENNSCNEVEKSKPKLCRTCSKSVPSPLSQTIEDISNLLPTDALNRPHLGLSYSMEDDLSPGVKEIRQTSTPKSDYGANKDSSSLSTFSLSASSLGYVSSQSDLELNNSSTESDKVPVNSLRSQTLPTGVNLSPCLFYSASESNNSSDHNDNIMIRNQNFNHKISSSELQLRSCSAPPLPEPEKTKKHFRGFSKKDKKDKKKNEDNLSLKSDLSLDEGVILRKIETLDGTAELDSVNRTDKEMIVEKKRWSMWRSILKKK